MTEEFDLEKILGSVNSSGVSQLHVASGDNIQGVADPNKMRPDVMQFLMTAAMASHLGKIRKYLEDRTPNGFIETWVINGTELIQRFEMTHISQSIAFICDGPNPAGIWINTLATNPHTIGITETYLVQMQVHKLERFWVQCNPGHTSQIRAAALN